MTQAAAHRSPSEEAPLPAWADRDPAVRLLCALGFAATMVGTDQLLISGAALLFPLCLSLILPLPWRTTLKRMAAVEGFMLAVLILLPFTVAGTPLFSLGGWTASQDGGVRALSILLKSNAVALAMLTLLGSMPVIRLGQALRRLGFPDKLTQLLIFTVRYIAVLDREYRRLRLAMKARGFRMTCSPHCWRSIGYLFGMLLVQSLERSDRIAAAMRCRGFAGTFPVLADDPPLAAADYLLGGVTAAVCLGLIIGDRV